MLPPGQLHVPSPRFSPIPPGPSPSLMISVLMLGIVPHAHLLKANQESQLAASSSRMATTQVMSVSFAA